MPNANLHLDTLVDRATGARLPVSDIYEFMTGGGSSVIAVSSLDDLPAGNTSGTAYVKGLGLFSRHEGSLDWNAIANNRVLSAEQIGARCIDDPGYENHDSYLAIQRALTRLGDEGGGALFLPRRYKVFYLLFVPSNVTVFGLGQQSEVIFVDPTGDRTGRGGFVIGNSDEQNRDVALAKGEVGDYTSPAGTFENLPVGTYLRDNPDKVQTFNSCIHDLTITPEWTQPAPNNSGGYAINMCNAKDCTAYNIWGDDWTELVNMGSDVPPASWSCHDCHAWNLFVRKPNNETTYYAIGFIANSTDCTIHNAHVEDWCDDIETDGLYIVACEDCHVWDVTLTNRTVPLDPALGDTRGVMIQGGKRNTIRNVTTHGLHICAGMEIDKNNTSSDSWEDANVISGVASVGTLRADYRCTGICYGIIENAVSVSAPQTYRLNGDTQHLHCEFKRGWTAVSTAGNVEKLNDVTFGKFASIVLQPGLADLVTGAATPLNPTRVNASGGTTLALMKNLPDFTSVILMRAFGTFASGAQTAGNNAEAQMLVQLPHNSNSNYDAQITTIATRNVSPTSDGASDFTLTIEPRIGVFDRSNSGLMMRFKIDNAVAGCAFKSIIINGYVYD